MFAIDGCAALPPSVEDGVIPACDLSEYENPSVLLAAYKSAVTA